MKLVQSRLDLDCKSGSLTKLILLGFIVSLVGSIGCSGSVSTTTPEKVAVSSGAVLVARSVPEISAPDFEQSLLGFMPINELSATEHWVAINGAEKTVELMRGRQVVELFEAPSVATDFAAGSYKVELMQSDALWYAPDQYFENRGLETPPAGSKGRYLKGALGNQVIYLSESIFLHDSPLFAAEVGGLQLDSESLQKLAELIEVGSVFVVR